MAIIDKMSMLSINLPIYNRHHQVDINECYIRNTQKLCMEIYELEMKQMHDFDHLNIRIDP